MEVRRDARDLGLALGVVERRVPDQAEAVVREQVGVERVVRAREAVRARRRRRGRGGRRRGDEKGGPGRARDVGADARRDVARALEEPQGDEEQPVEERDAPPEQALEPPLVVRREPELAAPLEIVAAVRRVRGLVVVGRRVAARGFELRAEDAPHLGQELLGEHADRSDGRRPRRRGENETSQGFGPRRPSPRVACHGDSSPAVELRLMKHEGFSLAAIDLVHTVCPHSQDARPGVLDMRSRDNLPVSGGMPVQHRLNNNNI